MCRDRACWSRSGRRAGGRAGALSSHIQELALAFLHPHHETGSMAPTPTRRRLGRVSKARAWGGAGNGSGNVWAGPWDRLYTAGRRRKSDWTGTLVRGLLACC